MFGLENSILSPNNPWFQAGTGVANFALGSDSPFASLTGGGGGGAGAPTLGTQNITLGDGSTISIPTYGTSGGPDIVTPVSGAGAAAYANGQSGNGGAGAGAYGSGKTGNLSWSLFDGLAAKFGLTMTSGYRPANGPTINGTPAAQSFHASGRAHDYSNTPTGVGSPQELAFANYVAKNYGSQLAELIFDAPGFSSTIKNGRVVGPFGSYYTNAQAGPHNDHVHVAFSMGGAAFGPGGPRADQIPAWLSNGEHVLTADDVNAMGGQDGVYAFRNALHRAAGGGILSALIPTPAPPPKPNFDPGAGAQKKNTPNIPMPAPAKVVPSVPDRGAAPLPPPEPAKLLPAPIAAPGEQPGGEPPVDVNSDVRANKGNPLQAVGMGAAPTSYDHTLPALSKGIQGAAGVIGNLVSMAASAAAAGGTMGASAMAGGMGGAQAGQLASALITQGGKIAAGIANVGSSFLVGTITGGTTPNAYGETLRPYQNAPVTSSGRTQINTFNGMDVPRVFQELDLRNAQDQQASLAHRPVR